MASKFLRSLTITHIVQYTTKKCCFSRGLGWTPVRFAVACFDPWTLSQSGQFSGHQYFSPLSMMEGIAARYPLPAAHLLRHGTCQDRLDLLGYIRSLDFKVNGYNPQPRCRTAPRNLHPPMFSLYVQV
jgi:hypothetical protein